MTDPARWSSLNESERALLRAAIRFRDISPDARHDHTCDVIDALLREAVSLTSDDPPAAPIEMPEGWELDSLGARNGHPDNGVAYLPDTGEIQIAHCGDALEAPIAAVAATLRSAGWRVEGPR